MYAYSGCSYSTMSNKREIAAAPGTFKSNDRCADACTAHAYSNRVRLDVAQAVVPV